VEDIFAGRGITESYSASSNQDALEQIVRRMQIEEPGLIIATLTDFDTLFGHRNDPAGFAQALREFDAFLPSLLAALKESDILVVAADHGCDPTTESTDHSREYVPLLIQGAKARSGINLGSRNTFADLGQTMAEALKVGPLGAGSSFWRQIAK
jgi:phosphopentomutase